MRVAVPFLGSRVSPRCQITREMALVTLEGEEILDRRVADLDLPEEGDIVERLVELEVDLLVCGGMRRELEEQLRANGIEVVSNVAGEVDEVLEALGKGTLRRGHGLRTRPGRAAAPASPSVAALPPVDCLACESRSCAAEGACPVPLGALARPWLRGEEARIFETGQDVSAEMDPKLCRIAELVHFCLGAGYSRIGLAFCWELIHEVEVLVPVLRRFFAVVPVCCRIGAGAPGNGDAGATCNPVALARILDREEADLNVVVGLCLGTDILFTRRSRAPVTTLFVKDRSLAHNPVGAIYTRYHLMDLTGERGHPRAARSGRR